MPKAVSMALRRAVQLGRTSAGCLVDQTAVQMGASKVVQTEQRTVVYSAGATVDWLAEPKIAPVD